MRHSVFCLIPAWPCPIQLWKSRRPGVFGPFQLSPLAVVWALRLYSASPDVVARFRGEKERRVGEENGQNVGGTTTGDGEGTEVEKEGNRHPAGRDVPSNVSAAVAPTTVVPASEHLPATLCNGELDRRHACLRCYRAIRSHQCATVSHSQTPCDCRVARRDFVA